MRSRGQFHMFMCVVRVNANAIWNCAYKTNTPSVIWANTVHTAHTAEQKRKKKYWNVYRDIMKIICIVHHRRMCALAAAKSTPE